MRWVRGDCGVYRSEDSRQALESIKGREWVVVGKGEAGDVRAAWAYQG